MNSSPDRSTIIRGFVKIDELAASGHIFHRYSEELYPILLIGQIPSFSDRIGLTVDRLPNDRSALDLVGYFRKLARACGYRVIECGQKQHNGKNIKLYRIG